MSWIYNAKYEIVVSASLDLGPSSHQFPWNVIVAETDFMLLHCYCCALIKK
jgi:hypothetical protein